MEGGNKEDLYHALDRIRRELRIQLEQLDELQEKHRGDNEPSQV